MYKQHRTCQNLDTKETKLKDRICRRKVSEVKYEDKTVPRMYWKGKIKKVEQPVILPHDRRKQYVQKMVPEDVFSAILNVLCFEDEDITEDTHKKSSVGELEKLERVAETVPRKQESFELQIPEEELLPGHTSKVNPYINFLKKSSEDANIWLPKKPPDFRVKPLIEKSSIITHNIINDFVEWLNTLGPINSDISLNEKTLQKMFRIGINEFAIKSLCIDVKEMGSVPFAVANATQHPEKSTRRVLQENLARDIKAEKLKKHTHAFGSALPVELQKFPPHNDTYNRWIKCSIPNELKTMECVFKDITEINSVKAYCQWLIDHPKLPRPQYLVDMGLLNPKYWKQTMSVDTRELEAFIAATLKKEYPSLERQSKKSITFDRASMSMTFLEYRIEMVLHSSLSDESLDDGILRLPALPSKMEALTTFRKCIITT
ncbi:uncharacterized protein LOC123292929 [Chrysoperla carnea]|uniref:uncharacterized protein LOC123292929 n=1 Tax=Chrysoperla carnea TaxID=189513 RepID=UPI001D099DF0|nr:uncharacterized protein LOC123292929 [Chrysoperla carnea]